MDQQSICPSCRRGAVSGASYCPHCGAPMAPGATGHIPPSSPRRKGSTADAVAGAGTLIVLISLFLPWYRMSYGAGQATIIGRVIDNFMNNGFHTVLNVTALGAFAGGWRMLMALTTGVTLVFLFARYAGANWTKLGIDHWVIVTALTGITALLVVLGLFAQPNVGIFRTYISTDLYGAYIGVAGAVIGLFGAGILGKLEHDKETSAPQP